MVAGVYTDIEAIVKAAPLVTPTSPPIISASADPDYAWDIRSTPGRLYDFLMAVATHYPLVPPSAYLETFYLINAMFSFTWEHPVMVRNISRELELFFVRTFWNIAVRYDEEFTEEAFHELTECRYVRCLDPSSKLILKRTLDLEDAQPERKNIESWRIFLCNAYADWAAEVEGMSPYYVAMTSIDTDHRLSLSVATPCDAQPAVADPYIASSFTWVQQAVSMEVLPSELESLADVEQTLEDVLDADLDIREELEAEAVDLSTSYSNRVLADTPTSTSSAPAAMVIVVDGVMDGTDAVPGVVVHVAGSDSVDEVASQLFYQPSSRLTVRTRPAFGSQSTAVSEENEASKAQRPQLSSDASDNSAESDQSPSASSSVTTAGSSSLGRFFKRPAIRNSTLSATNASSFATTISSTNSIPSKLSTGNFLTVPDVANGPTSSSALTSSTDTSSDSAPSSIPTDTSMSGDSTPDASHAPFPPSLGTKFGSFIRRLVGRRRLRNLSVHPEDSSVSDSLVPPMVMGGLSEANWTIEAESANLDSPRPVEEVLGARGPWAKFVGFPRLYWELKMAERKVEAA
ncbi:hypothetical protein NMY22_g13949 [Coprinellus aureogranulatus]|nr:hypothetical protein NMY22_g13949 [Coprinellus aureogranulatus]